MDFGVMGLSDHHHHNHNHHHHHHHNPHHHGLGVSSSSSSEPGFASNNVISSSSSSDPETNNDNNNKPRTLLYGSEFSSKSDEYWRSSKVAKISNNNDTSLLRSNNNNNCNESNNTTTTLSFLDNGSYNNNHSQQHQMLSFSNSSSSSSPTNNYKSEAHINVATLPYFPNPNALSAYTTRNTGYNNNSMMMMMRSSGPFTASQWMELEHQALIYKYITANVPIPSNLLIPIRKAFDSAATAFSPSLLFRSNPLGGGWGSSFHLGFSNNADPEPGRCRRTDGKKWRCSRDAVTDQKYCERHMNRGRHRSRKPVEGHVANLNANLNAKSDRNSNNSNASASPVAPINRMLAKENPRTTCSSTGAALSSREFGAVTSVDSLLLKPPPQQQQQNSLHQFIESWPAPDRTQLSISIPNAPVSMSVSTETSLSPLRLSNGATTRQWGPISWDAASASSASLGGPLGEALNHPHNNNNINSNNYNSSSNNDDEVKSVLNLMPDGTSPTGVLQRTAAFASSLSNSSEGSSPARDLLPSSSSSLPAL